MLGPFGRHWRIQAENRSTGVTIAIGGVVVDVEREKFDSSGALVTETPKTQIYSNTVTITNTAFDQSGDVDNSVDKYLGATIWISVTTPGTPNGDVVIRLQVSPDGVEWPDDGEGSILAVINFTVAGTKKRQVRI